MYKYYIKVDGFGEKEVAQKEFISFERQAGFRPKPGCGPVATGGFMSGNICGRTELMDEMITHWIPESPTYGGLYASKEPIPKGKLGGKGTAYFAMSAEDALHFDTKEECKKWCNEWNKDNKGKFIPVEHGFYQ